jgi:hypothetical protein
MRNGDAQQGVAKLARCRSELWGEKLCTMQNSDPRFEETICIERGDAVPHRRTRLCRVGVLPLARTPYRGCYLWNEKLLPLARTIATFGMKNCYLWREQNTTYALQPSRFCPSDVLTV